MLLTVKGSQRSYLLAPALPCAKVRPEINLHYHNVLNIKRMLFQTLQDCLLLAQYGQLAAYLVVITASVCAREMDTRDLIACSAKKCRVIEYKTHTLLQVERFHAPWSASPDLA